MTSVPALKPGEAYAKQCLLYGIFIGVGMCAHGCLILFNAIVLLSVNRSTEGLMSIFKTFVFMCAAAITLAACGTIEGAGRDIESVGDAIADEARD